MQAFTLEDKEEKMIEEFTRNIEKILRGAKLKSINDFKIILIRILHVEHFYVISFNLEEQQIYIIDKSAKDVTNKEKYGDVPEKTRNALAGYLKSVDHPNTDDTKHIESVRMEMKWRTKDNGIECGIFCMRHMECYDGEIVEKWNCGFHEEYEQPVIIKKG
ncbi:putative Ulp1 protease family catalytic domain, papain-like cysteine peptidase superfamily [Helianthus annuus]|nr:putative Ulp1 protease family catalytic domain, papain-like cysteine peptidase superfamily [Helianthus annuus]